MCRFCDSREKSAACLKESYRQGLAHVADSSISEAYTSATFHPDDLILGIGMAGSLLLLLKMVLRGDNISLAKDIRKEMKALNGKFLKVKDRNTKRDIRKELKRLSKEERKRQ
ncbi:hypothetical protein L6452_43728 [Arctium lappa]|uniref:Uncharacterized protein n=1 Tax=Arctium lappa TaxID=4217 RepID=A0ACB8XHQ3_ARCLA|nr:hypothetical protein L6452_43728 [Arctium lappa]